MYPRLGIQIANQFIQEFYGIKFMLPSFCYQHYLFNYIDLVVSFAIALVNLSKLAIWQKIDVIQVMHIHLNWPTWVVQGKSLRVDKSRNNNNLMCNERNWFPLLRYSNVPFGHEQPPLDGNDKRLLQHHPRTCANHTVDGNGPWQLPIGHGQLCSGDANADVTDPVTPPAATAISTRPHSDSADPAHDNVFGISFDVHNYSMHRRRLGNGRRAPDAIARRTTTRAHYPHGARIVKQLSELFAGTPRDGRLWAADWVRLRGWGSSAPPGDRRWHHHGQLGWGFLSPFFIASRQWATMHNGFNSYSILYCDHAEEDTYRYIVVKVSIISR